MKTKELLLSAAIICFLIAFSAVIRALKKRKYKGIENTRTLLPQMPWQNFERVHLDDIKAVYAYLKSIKPVSNLVPLAIAPQDMK